MKTTNIQYVAPSLEIIEVAVEQGFSTSNIGFTDEFGDPV